MKPLLAGIFLTCLLGALPAVALAAPETVPPTDIATGAATPTDTSARVLGYFNYGNTMPLGIAKACWFDYGTTIAYGSRESAICSGTTIATLAPLVPGTTYHYRAGASNEAGTSYGPDKVLATLRAALPPNTPPPPANPPAAALEVVSGQSLASVLRSGLRLRVALAGPCPCVVRSKLIVSRSTRKRLGIKSATSIALNRRQVGAAGAAKVRLRLKTSVKRKLRHVRLLKATVQVKISAASGQPVSESRSLRLKRPR